MISVVLSLALAAATSPAADPAGATRTEQPAKAAKPKKVCEKVEMSGSNVPKRVCRTVTQPVPSKDESARGDTNQSSGGATQ